MANIITEGNRRRNRRILKLVEVRRKVTAKEAYDQYDRIRNQSNVRKPATFGSSISA